MNYLKHTLVSFVAATSLIATAAFADSLVDRNPTLTAEQKVAKQTILNLMGQSFDGFPFGFGDKERPDWYKRNANRLREKNSNLLNAPFNNLTMTNLDKLLSGKYHVGWSFMSHDEDQLVERWIDIKYFHPDGRLDHCAIDADGFENPKHHQSSDNYEWKVAPGINSLGASGIYWLHEPGEYEEGIQNYYPVIKAVYDEKVGGLITSRRSKLAGRWYTVQVKGSLQTKVPAFAVDHCPNLHITGVNRSQTALEFATHMSDTSLFYKRSGLTLFPQDLMKPLTFQKVFFDYEGDGSEFATIDRRRPHRLVQP
jgi:methionine-rich copper-binding protein CopC